MITLLQKTMADREKLSIMSHKQYALLMRAERIIMQNVTGCAIPSNEEFEDAALFLHDLREFIRTRYGE